MIAGVGTDIVAIDSFRTQLADPASSFVQGTFTAAEQDACKQRPSGDPVIHLAARYAAKEAFIKAWSASHWGEHPALSHVDLREIELLNDPFGRPALRLSGDVAAAFSSYGDRRHHVSISHDGDCAIAFVVLEHS